MLSQVDPGPGKEIEVDPDPAKCSGSGSETLLFIYLSINLSIYLSIHQFPSSLTCKSKGNSKVFLVVIQLLAAGHFPDLEDDN